MKQNEWYVYVREYSELPGLQQAGSLRYSLSTDNAGCCLQVQRYWADGRPADGQCAVCRLSGVTRSTAEHLLRYLYENGVEPVHARDIVQDSLQTLLSDKTADAAGEQPLTAAL